METPAIKTNSLETPTISHKDSNLLKPTADSETAVTHKNLERKPTTTHEDEKIALIISLNFAVWCTSSACGVSSAHLNYSKHPMIRSVYRFHVYYQVRRVLIRLQTLLPHEIGFNTADNPYTESEFFKICEDYRVPNDPMRYRDEKFYWTY